MHTIVRHCILAGCCLLLTMSCDYRFPTRPEPSDPVSGREKKFEKVIVLGGSVSAGLMDGALYSGGQFAAYPNLFGARLDTVFGENTYGIPAVDAGKGYNPRASTPTEIKGPYFLDYRNYDSDFPARKTVPGSELAPYRGTIDSLNNFSFPGVRSYEMGDRDSLAGNKFYERIADKVDGKNLVEIALSKNPSLLLLSIGTDDVYSYIINGASGRVPPPSSPIGKNDATPIQLFEQSLQSIVGNILNNTESEIILPTVINPTDFFFFNTLPWFYTNPEIESSYSEIVNFYEDFNRRVQTYNHTHPNKESRPIVVFDREGGADSRAKAIVDENLPMAETGSGQEIPKYRQMGPDESLLYSAEPRQYESLNNETRFGTLEPISDEFILTKTERDSIEFVINSYNEILRNTARNSDRIKLLDLASLIEEVGNEKITYDGVLFSTGVDQNTIVSADGYFLNKKGQALLANELIKLINKSYGTDFRLIDVNSFEGNHITY